MERNAQRIVFFLDLLLQVDFGGLRGAIVGARP
jgi:hypothetical protein